LTDCHMPNLDGYELTASIRRDEEGRDGHLPIIAITASALHGEAEKCLEAGMDGYLTKPLEMDKLENALLTWLAAAEPREERSDDISTAAEKGGPLGAKSQSVGAVDLTALSDIFGEDQVVLREILHEFVGPTTAIVDTIASAVASGDLEMIGSEAHKLKSSSRAIGANELADICAALEIAGKSGDNNRVADLFAAFNPAFERVVTFIRSY